jgi:hypothetical protein
MILFSLPLLLQWCSNQLTVISECWFYFVLVPRWTVSSKQKCPVVHLGWDIVGNSRRLGRGLGEDNRFSQDPGEGNRRTDKPTFFF